MGRSTTPHGFHEGERAVQDAAGVGAAAGRLEGMLGRPDLGDGVRRFLRERTFAAVTARDADGRLWVSALTGSAGFIEVAGPTGVRIHTAPGAGGDPLHGLPADQPVGTIVIDFARRRRFRLNGHLVRVADSLLEIEVGEAFGNCPQYIVPRRLAPADGPRSAAGADPMARGLEEAEWAAISDADTFVLGTTHPERGADASHRGGPPGFVGIAGDTLSWPDYPGNNMFTSLGNLAVDPTAALAFLDFDRGRTIHLSGVARLVRTGRGTPLDDGGTGRRVAFDTAAVARSTLALRTDGATPAVPTTRPTRSRS